MERIRRFLGISELNYVDMVELINVFDLFLNPKAVRLLTQGKIMQLFNNKKLGQTDPAHLIDTCCMIKNSPDLMEICKLSSLERDIKKVFIVSKETQCVLCGSEATPNSVTDAMIYDDNFGTKECMLMSLQCLKKSCRAVLYPGFVQKKIEGRTVRFYSKNWCKLKYFVSNNKTIFSTDFMQHTSVLIHRCSVSFRGRAEAYNIEKHYDPTTKDRMALDRRRLCEAYHRFSYLKFLYRHGKIRNIIMDGAIDDELKKSLPELKSMFEQKADNHSCSNNGCNNVLVIDGHMKAHRKLCKRECCENDPEKGSLFCKTHTIKHSVREVEGDSNIQKLHNGEYHIENITAQKFNSKTRKVEYKVKWLGYEDTTWEPKENIPRIFIEQFNRFGNIKGKVNIVETSRVNGLNICCIEWENNEKDWLPECALELNPGAYSVHVHSDSIIKCNTHKDKKRFHHRTGGIMVGGRPCSSINLFEELIGSEAISNVVDMVDKIVLRKEGEVNIDCIAYDDACHLKKYIINHPEKLRSTLSSIDIRIDKFHFKNHIDPWCKEFCNPHESEHLIHVNTEVMEQFFSWISKYSYMVKYMSRFRFNFFLLDLIDKHNFMVEGLNPFAL